MPAMMSAATMPTAAKVPPTAPPFSKKPLFPLPLPLLPLSSPLAGREEVLVIVMGVPLGSVAEITEVTTVGSYEVVSGCCELLDVGLDVLVEVSVTELVDVCAERKMVSMVSQSAYDSCLNTTRRKEMWWIPGTSRECRFHAFARTLYG